MSVSGYQEYIDKPGRTPPPSAMRPGNPTSLDVALDLAARGLPVFPCTDQKRPALAKAKGDLGGYREASTDPDRIREMWKIAGKRAQLIGVPTGATTGFDALDLDPRNGSDPWRASNLHRLPETLIHGTPGLPKLPGDPVMPGEHWIFRHVEGVRNIQDGKTIAPGIDVRGDGGYVCFPPAGGYRVINEAEIADWPDWLLPIVLKAAEPAPHPDPASYATPARITEKRLRRFIDRELQRLRDAPKGGRHNARMNAGLSVGGVALDAGLSDAEAEEMLIAARPPEIEAEKERRTIRWALAEGRKRPIDLPDRKQFSSQRWREHPVGGRKSGDAASPPPPEAKPDKPDAPLSGLSGPGIWNPWDDPPLPGWPGGILPRQFEDTIAGICLRDGLDFPALATSYITAASGAAPKDARFCPFQGDAWRVPAIIWLMLVAESGQRKTQTLNHAMSMIKQRHGERWREYRDALKTWKRQEDRKESDKPAEPPPYYTNDITVERLQQLLAENDRGMLYCRDELASFLDFGRYSRSKGDGPRAFFLEAYEGGPHTVHRVGRDTVFINNAALALIGGIQPSRLSSFKGLESDGLLQRFAIVCAGPVGREKPSLVVKGKELLDARIDTLLAMPFAPHHYHTDAEGSALISSTREEGEAYAALPDFGVGFQGFSNKLHGTHARLTLILHMLEVPERNVIPMETVERAGRLTRFLLRHAARFYGAIPNSGLETMRAAASFLLRYGRPRVVASDLTTKVRPCRGMGLKELAALLSPLVAGGWITPEVPFPDNNAWQITPGLAEQFAARFASETTRAAEVRRLIRGLIPDDPDNPDANRASPYTA